MDDKRGVFIVIEGSDGSGKATQLGLIKKRLEDAGHAVETFDFPRYGQPSSYFVKRYLEGAYGGVNEVGPYTSSLFYALDRFEAAPDIRRALGEGKVVLADRFSGSNMAHQGTKIANAEQRRGFFIWLDNLEFEMLRVPRPDISFVLRVPAKVSLKLMADRPKSDIHEADVLHLERTVAVYDDMTGLFPKDFQRIDCVRGGELLDKEAINNMLWEKISPLLPNPARPVAKPPKPKAEEAKAAETVAESKEPAAEPQKTNQQLVIKGASGLLAQKIERFLAKPAQLEHPGTPDIHVPANLLPGAKNEYESAANTLLGLHAKLVAGLGKHGAGAQTARQTADLALPIAATTTISLNPDDPNLEELIRTLLNDQLPEAQAAGASLLAQAVNLRPERFKDQPEPPKKRTLDTVKALAEEFLAENYIGAQQPAQLTAVWPRNEADLVADMLYPHSSLPLRTIQDRVANWPMGRKLAVFEAYIAAAQPGPVLQKARYSWDLLCPYSTFRELQKFPSEALAIQPLTPRYGYDTPQLVEDAGLSDTFEKCFDLSLELYSALQKAGHQQEAQYAALNGHNQRWQMTQNAVQTLAMHQANTSPDAQKLLQQMQEKLAETHPILGELITVKST